MKVLIISSEVWRDDSNGGNTLSSIFSGTNFEFAQIFCNSGTPINSFCDNYLQITESSSLQGMLKNKDPFSVLNNIEAGNFKQETTIDPLKKKFKSFKLPIFYLLREILFNSCHWKRSKKLSEFLSSFKPDIIFAPTYASPFLNKLSKYISDLCSVPVVSYISDDNYSLKQFSLSLFYWVNRFWIRKSIRHFYRKVDLLYTMTDEQKEEIKSIFNREIKLLRKDSFMEPKIHSSYDQSKPKCIYAGGVYLKRYKNLLCIQRLGKKVFGNDFTLDIYSNCDSKRIIKKLVNSGCRVFKSLPYKELMEKYRDYDVAIHTESFRLKEKLLTRLSFSTKIIDCLSSGCATIAFLPSVNSGYKFIEKNNLGLCCHNKKQLYSSMISIRDNVISLKSYASVAVDYCTKNSWEEKNNIMVKSDFERLVLRNN